MPTNNPDELLRGIGMRIAELRKAHAWTQERLAEQIGYTTRYIQAVEAGTENLSVKSLAYFATQLGVDVSELFRKPQRNANRSPLKKRRPKRDVPGRTK